MLNKKQISVFMLSFFLIFTNVFSIEPVKTEWGIQYNMIPENPSPGDYVFLEIYSYSIDLNTSNISYILDGRLKKGGTGVKSFNFKIPDSNKTLNLEIVAEDFKGKVERRNIKIKPASVDLIYEVVDPYRPLFYKGKSIALSNSALRFFAFPEFVSENGNLLDKRTLIYKWKVNNKVLTQKSGIGKDKIYIDKIFGYPRETKVSVEVESLDGRMRAKKTIILKPGMSKIDFYIDDKILPFRFKSVAKNNNLVSNFLDSNIIAVPYFFNDINLSKIEWWLNGNKINLLSESDNLKLNIVKNENNVNLDLKIKLNIENLNRPLQASSSSIFFKSSKELIEKYNKIKNQNDIREEDDNYFFGL